MSNIDAIHQQRLDLQSKIDDMEAKLARMKTQLATLEAAEQHDAIDHLEECLDEVEHSFGNLKTFGQALVADLKKLFSNH